VTTSPAQPQARPTPPKKGGTGPLLPQKLVLASAQGSRGGAQRQRPKQPTEVEMDEAADEEVKLEEDEARERSSNQSTPSKAGPGPLLAADGLRELSDGGSGPGGGGASGSVGSGGGGGGGGGSGSGGSGGIGSGEGGVKVVGGVVVKDARPVGDEDDEEDEDVDDDGDDDGAEASAADAKRERDARGGDGGENRDERQQSFGDVEQEVKQARNLLASGGEGGFGLRKAPSSNSFPAEARGSVESKIDAEAPPPPSPENAGWGPEPTEALQELRSDTAQQFLHGPPLAMWHLKWLRDFPGGRHRHLNRPLIQRLHFVRREMERGILRFNEDAQKGIAFLVQVGLINENPNDVAEFLRTAPGLRKTQVGEYLGSAKSFNLEVMAAYVHKLDLSGKDFDTALRYFLSGFRLPGEAQKIDRLMEQFAKRFCLDNPGIFPDVDSAYVLSFALIMLNTDAHSEQVKNRMTKKQFLRNSRELLQKGVSKEFMLRCYDNIVNNEIQIKYDYLEQFYARLSVSTRSPVQIAARTSRRYSFDDRALSPAESEVTALPTFVGPVAAAGSAPSRSATHTGAFSSQQSLYSRGSGESKLAILKEKKEDEEPSVSSNQSRDGGEAGWASIPLGRASDVVSPVHGTVPADVARKLHAGTVFIKHGRQGKPHPRKVWLSEDLSWILYQDREQKNEVKRISVSHIVDVEVGRDVTPSLRRTQIIDTNDTKCFALFTRHRSLDLQASTDEDVRLWVNFLRQVVDKNQTAIEAKQLEGLRARKESLMQRQKQSWAEFMAPSWTLYQTSEETGPMQVRFRDIWRQGVPSSVRPKAWPRAIGNELAISAEMYESLRELAKYVVHEKQPPKQSVLDSLREMRADLPNTFPELRFFHDDEEDQPMAAGLREVLETYIVFRPDVGYMPGMSHIAAMLMLYVDKPFDSFVCFANLMATPFSLAFARMDMAQIRWRFEYFNELFRLKLPDLYNHFQFLRVSPELYLLDWCSSLFVRALPHDAAAQIWDMFFIDGEFIVLKAAIAILTYFNKLLLRSGYEDCIAVLRGTKSTLHEFELSDIINALKIDERAFTALLLKHTVGIRKIKAHRVQNVQIEREEAANAPNLQ
jgi:hypothetical protein